ncbi:MAG: NAD(P)-dependent oxidoreductase [Caldilineaceae bacterium]|nr:NAD(P)-dependent oxidoreductase [Caldilineaceae bacterium]MDE0339435.1 NAD(P)-dependent oxidoreductase [Caldilineaceae bacterium]
MNILVTGGSGKIGGYVLRELLSAGHVLSNFSQTAPLVEDVRHFKGDITDLEQMQQACRNQDAIVHLAAVPGPGITTPERLMYVNDRGTYTVLEAAVGAGARKVIFGSSKEAMNTDYRRCGTRPRYFPVDEEHPAEPRNEYGISKLINEITCKRYTEDYGIQTISLRINHNWYLDRAGAAVAVQSGWSRDRTVEEQWEGYRRYIVDSDLGRSNLWTVTDARDAARAFRLALENEAIGHEVFLINGADTCSLEETPALAARHYGDVPLRRPLAGFDSFVSTAKARKLLGYEPRYTWRQSEFREWMEAQP